MSETALRDYDEVLGGARDVDASLRALEQAGK